MEEQKANVVITRSPKSQGISFILTFLFGPLGLFYSTVLGGVVMLVLGIIIAVITLGVGAILAWLGSIIWGAIAVSSYNNKLLTGNTGGESRTISPQRIYSETTSDKPEVVTEDDRSEYAEVLSLKTDDELKALVRDEKMYDPVFIAVVREELQARVIGKRRQRTEEEIREEKRLEEEKIQKQKEE